MSDIDCIRHFRAGILDGIPLYIACEDGDKIFNDVPMLTSQIAIGGGSGEHDALLITDPLVCVAHYLAGDFVDAIAITPEIRKKSEIDPPSVFQYCNEMRSEDWITELSPLYLPIENWLADEVGKFLYHCVRKIYPQSDVWFDRIGRLDDDTAITIPWDVYGGNGTNLFNISQTNIDPTEG